MEPNNNKLTPKHYIPGALVLLWFFGSLLVGTYFFRNNREALGIAVWGQIFAIGGCAAIVSGLKQKNLNPVIAIGPIAGMMMVVLGLLWEFGDYQTVCFLEDNLHIFVVCIFIVIGLLVLINAFCIIIVARLRCKRPMTVTCIDILINYDEEGRELVCPVYEAKIGRRKIELCNNIYSTTTDAQVGKTKKIYLNEYNSGEFYDPSVNIKMGLIVGLLGLFLVGVSILGLLLM